MEALFLEHEGYFGAVGAFLQSAFQEDCDEILSWSSKQHQSTDQKIPTTVVEERPASAGDDETNPLSRRRSDSNFSARSADWVKSQFRRRAFTFDTTRSESPTQTLHKSAEV